MIMDWQVDPDSQPSDDILMQMRAAADQAPLQEGIKIPCTASVRICGEDAIREMNRAYRGMDTTTDVLSFPSVAYPAGITAGACPELLRREFDDGAGACFLGDIVISLPHLLRQAEEYGHSPRREGAYLLVHGLCHLMGYDHVEEEDQKRMRRKEEEILSAAGISREDGGEGDEALLRLAREAMELSYSPYSRFPVGAALRCADGRIYQGCNIENASYGLTNCAERTALFKAVSEGAREFTALAIASRVPAWPCGACRQVLNEFAPDLRVIITWGEGQTAEKNLRELLPESFGPEDLQEDLKRNGEGI